MGIYRRKPFLYIPLPLSSPLHRPRDLSHPTDRRRQPALVPCGTEKSFGNPFRFTVSLTLSNARIIDGHLRRQFIWMLVIPLTHCTNTRGEEYWWWVLGCSREFDEVVDTSNMWFEGWKREVEVNFPLVVCYNCQQILRPSRQVPNDLRMTTDVSLSKLL